MILTTPEIPQGVALVAAAASLPIAATQSKIWSPKFAADINSAEKGIIINNTLELEIKSSSAPKMSEGPALLIGRAEERAERTEASSTGTNRYAEVFTAVEGAIKEFSNQESSGMGLIRMKAWSFGVGTDIPYTALPILISPPTNTSTSTSSSDDTLVRAGKTTESQDGEGEPKAADTGLHRIIERNCPTITLLPTLQCLNKLKRLTKADERLKQMRLTHWVGPSSLPSSTVPTTTRSSVALALRTAASCYT
jgi:hypothetical protein